VRKIEGLMDFDLLIIGAGINGAGIARDAAGHGLKVMLCDAGDIGGATSASSTKLIHGGLRYLEFYEFSLVRKALAEREVILRIAPHIAWPQAFVLPHVPSLRPWWMMRLGLFLYDHLARRERVPGSSGIDLASDKAGSLLQPQYRKGFRYWDGWIEDHRLTLLNAMDARARGAQVRTHTKVMQTVADKGAWQCMLEDGSQISARMIVNAAGPWAESVSRQVMGHNDTTKLRLVKGSHIIVPRQNPTDDAYFFQQPDGRIIFLIPYEQQYSLIGTTESDHAGDPRAAAIDEADTDYLLAAANRFVNKPLSRADIRWTYAGVRPLIDEDGADNRSATRDYKLAQGDNAGAPWLSVLGGKITTYRLLAEEAMARIAPVLGISQKSWTGEAALPGGERGASAPAWLPAPMARRMLVCHGSLIGQVLGDAQSPDDLGESAGGLISMREVRYMIEHEWARSAEDILWRRTKLGLHLDAAAQDRLRSWV
jgi:glycerol-3-phosphate dehydrogenase